MGWRVVGACVRGTSHERTDTPCQDAWDHRVLEGGCVVAVADGAGSARLSHKGATLAVRWACEVLADALRAEVADPAEWRACVGEAFALARRRLEEEAKIKALPLHELACTLTCVVCAERLTAVGQVGDGLVVAQWTDDASLESLIVPQRGEYANETVFLTQPLEGHAAPSVQVFERVARGLTVITDGLLRLATHVREEYRPHPAFFRPFLDLATRPDVPIEEANRQIAEFLASPRVCERTNDDKTLVALWHDGVEG
ncbi:MAG: PP2C family serine/threonine-protein phosphatase [Candidatus Brachytrichaceae bacterium NZ_4S206]